MTLFLPDANVLIHALRKGSPAHATCRQWLQATVTNADSIGLCALVEVALLRIPTLPQLNLVPMDIAMGFWRDDLRNYPHTRRLSPGPRHTEAISRFISELKIQGNDINDAWLAALAIEHRATLVSTDAGFARFPGLSWFNPTA